MTLLRRREAEPVPEATVNCIMDAIKMAFNHELAMDLVEPLAYGLVYSVSNGVYTVHVMAQIGVPRNHATLLRIMNGAS